MTLMLIGVFWFVVGLIWMAWREDRMGQAEATAFSFVVAFGGVAAALGFAWMILEWAYP